MEDTAEFDKQDTVNSLDNALRKMGFETEQIGNCFQLIDALSAGKKWDLIFNIVEGLYGDGRESVVPAILDQYQIPYVFSGPVILGISLNKYLSRLIVSAAGVPVSPGMLISSGEDIKRCNLQYPLFIKPVSEGTGKGINEKSLLKTKAELKEMAEWILERFNQPALVEEYLPGREFTVGVIGSGNEAIAIGGMEIECKDNLPYSVEFKENYQEFCKYIPMAKEFSEECKTVALNVWKALGGVDAGRVDVKADRNGRMCFMEVNPLAGLHPIDSDLPILSRMIGIEYQTLIEMIMKSAIKRHKLVI
jgi:D-alanine-D-alanine ligase